MSYSSVAKWLHWLIAGAIVLQFILAKLAEIAAEESMLVQQLALLAHHKSVGISILLLASIRVLWRITHPAPSLPATISTWQAIASHISHWGLYVLLFAMPISGWLMSSASAYSVSWFNLVVLPDLVAPSESLKKLLQQWHGGLSQALFVIAALHILAALKHGLIDRDEVLSRMSSWGSVGLFFVVVALGLFVLTPDPARPGEVQRAVAAPQPDQISLPGSDLPIWQVDHEQSSISFFADQAGAPFTGRWLDWSAKIQFDPVLLDKSQANVSINVAAVSTEDAERDGTLLGSDFFAVDLFPTVEFKTLKIKTTDSGFSAEGILIIKSVGHPITFNFSVTKPESATSDQRVLTGVSRLDRLALGIGLGDWQDPGWVGQYVDVAVRVVATICADSTDNVIEGC